MNQKLSTKKIRALTVFWMVIVIVLHLIPSSGLLQASWLQRWQIDKLVHFMMFFPLGIGVKNGFHLRFVYAMFLVAIYASSLELIQGTVFVGRSTDVLDFCTDIIGFVVGNVIISSKKYFF